MKVSQRATHAHLAVGAILVDLALASFVATFFVETQIVVFLIFFFGIWGGVELGRYLENYLSLQT